MADFEAFKKAAASQTEYEKFKALSEPHPVNDFMTGLNRPLAGAVDAVMSPVAVGYELATGKRAQGLQTLFPPPTTAAGRIGEAGGTAATLAMGGGAMASRVPAAAASLTTRNAVQNFLNSIGVNFRNAPGAFVAAESAMGVGAGGGGEIAKTTFPNSDAARFIGEVLGGGALSAAQAAPAAILAGARKLPLTGAAIRGAQSIAGQVGQLRNPLAARTRAVERVGRATPTPETAAQRMTDSLLPGLTPAARTGDRGLLALESAADHELADADKFVDNSMNAVHQNIRSAISSFAGNPEATAQTFEQAQNALRKSLDDRLNIAARRTQETLASISPTAPREVVNRVAAGELRSALQAARNEERKLYELVPEDAIVPTQNVTTAYRNLFSDLSEAQREDMPAIASQMLRGGAPSSSSYTNPATGIVTNTVRPATSAIGSQTTIKEMRGLQSKLRQVARNSRSGDSANLNRARIADELADAITEDIANTQGGENVSGAVKAAVDYSRTLNEKFRKGTVGVLLGLAKQAEPRVPEGLVLENSIGVAGPRAREAFDDIIKATNSPEVNAAMEDFIKSKFFDYAVVDNQINPARAASFMRTNKEVLGRLPKVQQDIGRVMESMDVRDLRLAQRGRVSFDKPSVSRATMFIEKGPEQAFRSVLDARYPRREMANLVNMARRDATGEAEQGLKSAFSDYIVSRTQRGGNLSGESLNNFLTDPKTASAMRGIFTPAEQQRWRVIADTAARLDLQRGAKPSAEGVLGDSPGQLATVLARLWGAHTGSVLAKLTGTGGIQMQAIMSERFKGLLRKGIDPSKQLLIDAVQDEKLFKDLLMARVTPDNKLPEVATRRMNAWLATLPQDEEER